MIGTAPAHDADDPWSAEDLQQDPALEEAHRRARRTNREVVQVPRLRALGSALLFTAVCAHNYILLGGVELRLVAGYGALLLVYAAATTYSLRRHFDPDARVDLGSVYLALDIPVFLLAIYVSGGERSWLLPLLCVRVADQVGTSQRRAFAYATITFACHTLLVAELVLIEARSLSLTAEVAKVMFIYSLNIYLSFAAGPAEQQRKWAARMSRKMRTLLTHLAAETKSAEQERRRAELASQAKSRFLANMSHEIRTPLNGVLGAAEMLADAELPQEQRLLVDTIVSSGRGLLSIVNNVLDMSKIEAGELHLEHVTFQVAVVVRDVMTFFEQTAKKKGIRLESELCPDATARLFGDPLRLRQVLINLVGNAVKFTEQGSVRLVVSRLESEASSLSLRVEVVDTGIGMSEEAQTRIFEPFQQADDSTTRRFGGTGLGLSIAKQLVERMGGALQVESQVNEGTRFYFDLAWKRSTEAAPVAAPRAVEPDTPARLRALRAKVLVAEDTSVNRMLVQKMLCVFGCEVTCVDNGAQAAELLCQPHGFALAILDWQMPIMDGLEATRRVRAYERVHPELRRIPIIGFTASVFAQEVAECAEAGMDSVLNKPLMKDSLQRALEQYLLAQASPSQGHE